MDILDNLNVIKQRDPDDALGVVANAAEQLIWRPKLENGPTSPKKPANIVLAGMGGSALAGLIAKNWLDLDVPFEIVRDYSLPHYVNDETLVICVSVSGNTEETLSALDTAIAKNAAVVAMAVGGKLAESARTKSLPFIELPKLSQPRYGTFAHLRAIAKIFETYGLANDASTEIADLYEIVTAKIRDWTPDLPLENNFAKQIAVDCVGKTPVIYSSSLFAPVAYKWKISFNENAKNIAFWNQFPEMNHNEFIGWASHPIEKPFAIIDLRSQFDHPRIAKRFDLSAKLLSGRRPAPQIVNLHGESVLCQMICGAILADFASIYLAILNGVNPTPVDLVEKLKTELG